MRPIGIFGGTFDPVHLGHLRPALEVADALDLERLLFVPTGAPPHRAAPRASAAARRALLEAAVAGVNDPRCVVDPRELLRPGPHYTVDTLVELRAELGAARPLVLILGADAFAGLAGWKRWRELIDLAHLAVMRRPGHGLPAAGPLAELVAARRARTAAAIAGAPAGAVWIQDVTPLEVSATEIRARLARGASVHGLVPEALDERIERLADYKNDHLHEHHKG